MARKNKIRAEYKLNTIGDVVQSLESGVSVKGEPDNSDVHNGVWILKLSSIRNGILVPSERKRIDEANTAGLKLPLTKDTILISRSNTPELVGECAYVENSFSNIYLPDTIWEMRLKATSNISGKWISYLLSSPDYRRKIKNSAAGTSDSMKKISKASFRNIKFQSPPLTEQTAIANLLSSWDRAIYLTTQLIAQKELRKKWLMHQLLTGKKRLKGFKEEWKLEPLNVYAREVSVRNKTQANLTVLSCTKYNGLVPSLEYFGRKIFADDLSTYKIVRKNQFAYATNHIDEGSIGYQAEFQEALISPMYTVFETDKRINDDFLFRLLKSYNYVHEYQKRMEGSIDRRGGLRWEEFSKIRVPVLPPEEQVAIAAVFQCVDSELELIRQKLEKLRVQKKGLMQMLLTGKKRLKI